MVTCDFLMTSNGSTSQVNFPANSALVFSSSSRYPRANPIPETNKTPRWPMGNGCNVSGSKMWQVYLRHTTKDTHKKKQGFFKMALWLFIYHLLLVKYVLFLAIKIPINFIEIMDTL